MGASGTGLFSDDVACDVRADYRALLEDGVDDGEAIARVLSRHLESLLDPADEPTVVLALAVAASKLGRLSPALWDRAVALLDSGRALERWSEDRRLLRARVESLARVRCQLTGPQPEPRPVRPRRRVVARVKPGDVLALKVDDRSYRAVRVVRLLEYRTHVVPVIQVLDWQGHCEPTAAELARCADLAERARGSAGDERVGRPTRVVIAGARDDPRDAGFIAVGTIGAREGDDVQPKPTGGARWIGLAARLRALDGET